MSLSLPSAYVDLCSTTVATGGYTSGSGVLNVASTGSPFPQSNVFFIYLANSSTKAVYAIGKVTAINSGTQFAVSMSTDASGSAGDLVVLSLCAASMDQIRADQIGQGAYASAVQSKKGNLYLPTDSPQGLFDNGSNLVPAGILLGAVTDPTSVSFTWRNQGSSATVTTAGGRLILDCGGNAGLNVGGNELRGQEISYSSTPISIAAGFLMDLASLGYCGAGLYICDHTAGSIVTLSFQYYNTSSNAALYIAVSKWTNSGSFSGQYGSFPLTWPYGNAGPIWLKVLDNGTNFIFYGSPDLGHTWREFFQVSRTDFLTTPDRIGWFINPSGYTSTEADGMAFGMAAHLFSWLQGTS
jgi:hypothetical protein